MSNQKREAMQMAHMDNDVNPSAAGTSEGCEVDSAAPVEVATLNGEKLIVARDDMMFDAARVLLSEHGLGNVMITGDAGAGKTRRAEGLTMGGNFRVLLNGSPLEGIDVQVKVIEVDLISTTASAELLYDSSLENGNFARQAAMVADFIQTHGTTDRAEFDAHQAERSEVLRSGRGTVTLYVLIVDDFDRCYREIQSSFMKLIHGNRHSFQRLKTPPYFLRLQCIATSNSGLGTPSGKYTAAAGRIDAAVANRFMIYHLPDPDFREILARRFPHEAGFCRTLSELVAFTKSKQRDGELESLGEVSLRQVMPLVEHKTRYGLTDEEAASRLFSPLPAAGDERTQANLILSRFFGRRRGGIGEFAF